MELSYVWLQSALTPVHSLIVVCVKLCALSSPYALNSKETAHPNRTLSSTLLVRLVLGLPTSSRSERTRRTRCPQATISLDLILGVRVLYLIDRLLSLIFTRTLSYIANVGRGGGGSSPAGSETTFVGIPSPPLAPDANHLRALVRLLFIDPFRCCSFGLCRIWRVVSSNSYTHKSRLVLRERGS